MEDKLALFEEKQIRKIWKDEKWYFSIIDVIYALTDSKKPRDYWYRMKQRVSEEEQIELSIICRQLKLKSNDGKKYNAKTAVLTSKYKSGSKWKNSFSDRFEYGVWHP